jgi:HNH endonuclease
VDCSVDDCASPVLARGWCSTHYWRWHRITEDGCWLPGGERWQPGKPRLRSADGDATRDGGRQVAIYRVSWEHHHGPVPVGLSVCHRCDEPNCFNPAHLFVGTANIRHGRTWRHVV